MNVTKSSGVTEIFEDEKLLKVLRFACENTNIKPTELLKRIKPLLSHGASTKTIQRTAIKVAADLIGFEQPDYQYVAARLMMYGLRKRVHNQFDPIHLIHQIQAGVDNGFYDKDLLNKWSIDEINEFNNSIDHNKDFNLAYAGAIQYAEKYLVRNRTNGKVFETPQHALMLISMCFFQDDDKQKRNQLVIDFYTSLSNAEFSLPTPIMGGLRTATRQFSSCVLIDVDDSLKSINAGSNAIINYISKRAGIGVNGGFLRAEGSHIRGGEVKHTGVIPFWKHFQTAVKSCSQGGIRGGAATLNYPIWHLEFEKLIVLKNNKGVDENRIRHLDYAPSINKLMFERLAADSYITLFSPDVANGKLYEAYFMEDQSIFKTLYESLERDATVRKTRIKASELFGLFSIERLSTNRIYPMFATNVNVHGPYKEPVKMSNLCMEILPPTTPVGHKDEEIALCTLAAINVGVVETQEAMQRVSRLVVRALDNLLDYQDYPHPAALVAKKRRALGIGVVNMAYLFAKNFVRYSETEYNNEANKLMHRTSESLQYWLLKASNELSEERGACEYHNRTRYADGLLPIDWYNKNVDDLVSPELVCDWESLRTDIKKHGLRHSTVTAWMPGETSAQVPNATNGPYTARDLVTLKESKEGIYAQLVPEIETLYTEYETTWQMVKRSGNIGWLGKMCIAQKFIDNGISCDTYEDPALNDDNKIKLSTSISDMCFAQRHGLKSYYYSITRDGADGNVVESESDCESCKM